MMWIWNLCIANMRRRGIRTILTILGVVIGVISIVSMVSIGLGVKKELLASLEETGNVRQIIVTGREHEKRKDVMINDRVIKKISKLEGVELVYPRLEIDWMALFERYEYYNYLVGLPREYLEQMELEEGGFPSSKTLTPEIIVGKSASESFYHVYTGKPYSESSSAKESLTGEKLDASFWDLDYTDCLTKKMEIVGTNQTKYDYGAYTDIESLKKFLKRNKINGLVIGQPVNANGENYNEWIYSSAVVEVSDTEQIENVMKALNNMGFDAENNKEMLDSINRTTKIIQILLGGIGMIALIVALIGISNTMTTAVYERIHEIGILKVLGCEMDELSALFLLEAGILGGVGGGIGIAISYGINHFLVNGLAVKLIQMPKGTQLAILPWWLIIGAFLFSVLLGLFAGYFPAKWASKMKPIDAVGKL